MGTTGTKTGRRSGRTWVIALCALSVFAGTAVLTTAISGANHQTIFEYDGNTVDNPAGSPWDWTKFFDGNGARITPLPDDFNDSAFDNDHLFAAGTGTTTTDLSTYTGGSKDILDINGWACANSNNLGGKFDIVNAYSTIYEVPSTGGGYTAGDLLLSFGIERSATEGDGNMGFWFLKSGVDCEKPLGSGGSPQPFTGGLHQHGDVFIVAGFSNGGTNASVTAYLWKDADGPGGNAGFLDVDNPFVTGGALCSAGTHEACGIVNTAPIATGLDKPWPSPDKNGGALDTNAFYEGFVRVPQSQVSGCFATFVANTRSSTSPTATLHDFSRGSFPTCQPSTSLAATPTPNATTGDATKVVVVGDQVTYTFTETNDGNTPLTAVKVTTDSAACNAVMSPSGTVNLAVGASAEFSCTIATDGTTPAVTSIVGTGEGKDSLNRNVTYCTGAPPANTVCDLEERATAKAASIKPSTAVTISPSPATARAGDVITWTITETNDGTGPAGTTAYDSYLALTSVAVSTGVPACDEDLGTKTGDTGSDNILSKGETWTYTCTTPAPATSPFNLTVTATGTVLAGTPNARAVTFCSPTCTAAQYHDADERASASVTIINPSTSLKVTAEAQITYTFRETNDGNSPLTPAGGVRTGVLTLESPTTCNVSAPVYVSGDQASGAGSLSLEPNETWVFTCVGSLPGSADDVGTASKTVTGIGHGNDATNRDVTYPGDLQERDRVTVTITNHAQGAD